MRTCHHRGAHAIGGMAAFIPNRRDPEVTERAIAAVTADKRREAEAGCDGTWVAHPDLVPVAREQFDAVLGDRPNQREQQRHDVEVAASDLLDIRVPDGTITEAGIRTNVRVGILYVESWLRGHGAAALFDLMEDAATAEISRSQLWQWVQHGALLEDGRRVTGELVRDVIEEEIVHIRETVGGEVFTSGRFEEARELFESLALADDLVEFLTIPAAAHLDDVLADDMLVEDDVLDVEQRAGRAAEIS